MKLLNIVLFHLSLYDVLLIMILKLGAVYASSVARWHIFLYKSVHYLRSDLMIEPSLH